MHLTTISVTYERKLNLGDWNSVRSGITLWAGLDEGDDEAKAAEELRNMARAQVGIELARLEPKLAAKVKNIFAGLPASVAKGLE